MGKKESGFGKILGCFPCSSSPSSPSSRPSCFSCINAMEPTSVHDSEEELERRPLVKSEGGRVMRLKDVLLSDDDDEHQTLAFQLKPKVSMYMSLEPSLSCCYGLALPVSATVL